MLYILLDQCTSAQLKAIEVDDDCPESIDVRLSSQLYMVIDFTAQVSKQYHQLGCGTNYSHGGGNAKISPFQESSKYCIAYINYRYLGGKKEKKWSLYNTRYVLAPQHRLCNISGKYYTTWAIYDGSGGVCGAFSSYPELRLRAGYK